MIKININWKLFFILLISSVIATILVLPYTLTLSPALAETFTPLAFFATLIQSIIEFSIAILIGLYLAKRVGFSLPILEGWLEGKDVKGYLKFYSGYIYRFGDSGKYSNYYIEFTLCSVSCSYSGCRIIYTFMAEFSSVDLWWNWRRNIIQTIFNDIVSMGFLQN